MPSRHRTSCRPTYREVARLIAAEQAAAAARAEKAAEATRRAERALPPELRSTPPPAAAAAADAAAAPPPPPPPGAQMRAAIAAAAAAPAQRFKDALRQCRDGHTTALDLRNCFLGPAGLKRLLAALQPDACKVVRLDLRGNNLEDRGARLLGKALATDWFARVTHLDLSLNGITDRGAEFLGKGLEAEVQQQTRGVAYLSLSANKLGNKAAVAIARALLQRVYHPALLELDVSKNRITDKGASALANLLLDHGFGPKVPFINFQNNRILGPKCWKWKKKNVAIRNTLRE